MKIEKILSKKLFLSECELINKKSKLSLNENRSLCKKIKTANQNRDLKCLLEIAQELSNLFHSHETDSEYTKDQNETCKKEINNIINESYQMAVNLEQTCEEIHNELIKFLNLYGTNKLTLTYKGRINISPSTINIFLTSWQKKEMCVLCSSSDFFWKSGKGNWYDYDNHSYIFISKYGFLVFLDGEIFVVKAEEYILSELKLNPFDSSNSSYEIVKNAIIHYENKKEKKFIEIKKQVEYFEKISLIEDSLIKDGKRQPIPEDVRMYVWRRDEGKCVQCDSQKNLEFDHIIPHSKGGGNTARNLQLLCQLCNRKKSDTI